MTLTFGDFIPILGGFVVNLEIAFAALVIGSAVGLPLALLRHRTRHLGRLIRLCVRLMQAAPTYAIMFFALTLIPGSLSLFGLPISGLAAVVIAQSVYLSAYVSDNALRALQHRARGEREQALLLLPNVMRGFFVVVMSSGFGAAIGVSEAVAMTLKQAERLHVLRERVFLFLVVIAFFVAVSGTANALLQVLVRALSRPKAGTAAGSGDIQRANDDRRQVVG